MTDYETKLEMSALNRDLAKLWLGEMDLLEVHRSTTLDIENRCVKAHNEIHRQRERAETILHGEKLRKVFGYV